MINNFNYPTNSSQKPIITGTDAFLTFLRDRINSINIIINKIENQYDDLKTSHDEKIKIIANYIHKNKEEIVKLNSELEKLKSMLEQENDKIITIEDCMKKMEVEKTVGKKIIEFFKLVPGWILTAITIGGIVVSYIINTKLLP